MDPVKKIISSFMSGEMPRKVQHEFINWYLRSDNAAEKDRALYEEWERMYEETPEGYNTCSPATKREHLRQLHKKIKRRQFFGWKMATACACAVLFLISAEYLMLSRTSGTITTCLVASEESKGSFTLPDGSHVWLNSKSRLEYDEEFGSGKTRKVRLVGEGFFDVTKSSVPFIVEMGEMNIKVLGTSFNARTSEFFPESQVTLSEGLIQISCGGKEILLKPGQQCSYNSSSGIIHVRNVDTSNYSSWTESSITFDNMSLADIITNLEHWYNVRIDCSPGVDTSVRLSFKLRPETIEETFSIIEYLTKYKYKITGDRRILIFNGG